MLYLISGNGQGAGKSYLAEKLVGGSVYSIAGEMRNQLRRQFPFIDWSNKSQQYKDTTIVGATGKTVRQWLVEYGQAYTSINPAHWVDILIKKLYSECGKSVVAIDDVRKLEELEALKRAFPNSIHFHVEYPLAVAEPMYPAAKLKEKADYVVFRPH